MAGRQEVEFKTLDGLTLRGWLYPAKSRGPGIIMTPGVRRARQTAFQKNLTDEHSSTSPRT